MDSPGAVAPGRSMLAGVVAALVALATTELVSALSGGDQSLVASVGDVFIDTFAGSLKDLAVALFGANDKVALLVGIVVISAGLGALAGRAAGSGDPRRRWVSPAVFVGFAVLGALAGIADPLAADGWAVLAATLGALAGLGTLRLLLGVARTGTWLPVATRAVPAPAAGPSDDPRRPAATRRAFFGWAGAAGAFAVAAGAGARALRGPSAAEVARAEVRLPTPVGPTNAGALTASGSLDVEGLTPYVVPNDEFYRIDTALIVPQVDPATWRLRITGLVDEPFELTYDELLALSTTEETVTLSCVSNEVGDDLVGNAVWQGVPLAQLLERARVRPEATQVVGRSVDGFTAGFPTEVALDGRVALVAVGMNGEALPIPHGFPARLVVSGLYGYVSATKWLSEIELTRWEDLDGYWIPRGWAKEGPVKTQSRIDVPRAGAALTPGSTPIAGVAWAPDLGIERVEVQVDDGPWVEATLGEAVSDDTWVQWVVTWDATPGEHRIQVRATDATGATQPEERTSVAPDGATGWHRRTVRVAET
ncbi:MAG: molybdopterin-dependent oxidoreductase [Acidimicrobiales bacterium]|jgi:DMSO/TMAO reductase YedYZ molybdopterin-dependent catalytic subunit|nr:molybdopterin-dependent oxidoreductase [Acidimicrobiales bacterium]